MLVKVYGSAISGITATTVCVEVSVDQGVGFFLVGPPDNAVKESYQRVSSALQCFGYKIPGKRIIINMYLPGPFINPKFLIISRLCNLVMKIEKS